MQQLGFIQSKVDPALHIFQQNSHIVYFLVYVHDILISGNQLEFVTKFIKNLKYQFKMKDLDQLSTFLRVKATENENSLFLSQEHYVIDILHRASMQTCQTISNPTTNKLTLKAKDNLP